MTSTTSTTNVELPALGEAVTEATITRWLKSVGDEVQHDEPLLEVATDKVDTEVCSPAAGILTQIIEPEDSMVEIGAVIAVISASDAAPNDDTAHEPERVPEVAEPEPDPEPEPVESATERVEKLSRIRRTIAQRMLTSLQTSAQLTTVVEVDLTNVALVRSRNKAEFEARTGQKLSYLPFVVSAAVEGLAAHPVINSSLNADCTEVTYHSAVHLGVAVDSDKGLMVPVIRNVESMTLAGLAAAIAASALAVRSGTVRPDDLSGGTFTITNTGSRGALFDTPIINQPQSAILGVGTVVERLVPGRDELGNLVVKTSSMAYLSLSYDHRIIDGADAARYLGTVRHRLERGFDDADLR
ncbi:2-oxo acid dehydrogenase subunit E2 [Mycolicibacterium porcinum]|uniref:Dihydrolipoamide acetyltransferase component of pyruvate dehydrogenase complex n=1 Tax=Mycolicibacterium porcinum TaxID=39693 RepID=A0AAW5T7C9_9MYCO|nr:2-oxo acid dehydrogenase subunit E2 [Mycolicibacterium porcinum]MCV7390456.1 2-oxo acid dehydrogenase subunit E2 [Mycolicibacterium porcinum]ORB36162.1 dihydrolipoyllysine succinyltransferase [Mycolicibacterium porcinum]CDO31045.1 2-oxoglutarate dehydrogenase E2 component [Mycolicibacterium vulneris]